MMEWKKCRIDSAANIGRRTGTVLKGIGKGLIIIGGVLCFLLIIGWVKVTFGGWLGWWWIGGGFVVALGLAMLLAAYAALHWIFCVDD